MVFGVISQECALEAQRKDIQLARRSQHSAELAERTTDHET